MYKILIIGGSSLLGNQLITDLSVKNKVTATYHIHKIKHGRSIDQLYLDIHNVANINTVIKKAKWDYILYTSSMGDVDSCEKNKRAAWETNVIATKSVVKSAKNIKTRFIYFSTNAIYDGNSGPYSELRIPNPINYYGKTKLEGEKEVKISGIDFVILRLNTMYGWNIKGQRENPATWIINSLRRNKIISVVDDIYNNHLWVGFVSKVIKKLLDRWKTQEIYNIGGSECSSRYDFAVSVAKVFTLNQKLITRVKNSQFENIAPRPKNTCFNTEKMRLTFHLKPLSLIKGLKEMRKQEYLSRK